MKKNFHLWAPVVATFLLAACRDPFPPDFSPQPPAGGVTAPIPPAPVPPGQVPPGYPPAQPPPAPMPPGGQPPAPPAPMPPPGQNPPPPPPGMPTPPSPTPPPGPLTIAEGPACEQAADPADPADLECPEQLSDLEEWFPETPEVESCAPRPRPSNTCFFYQFAWQHFLVAAEPNAQGTPDFLTWDTVEDLFGTGNRFPPGPPVLSTSVAQPGQREIVVDQNRSPIFYGTHLNDEFARFVRRNDLDTVAGIKAAPAELQFPIDVVQIRSAWQIVPQGQQPNNRMIRAAVRVPTLRVAGGDIEEDREALRNVNVQLIALDLAYTIPGHPEFIWTTFEAAAANGISFVAPSATALPAAMSKAPVTQDLDNALFGNGNFALFARTGDRTGIALPIGQTITDLAANEFNQNNQLFAQATSVHRVYRGSLSHTREIDPTVEAINEAVHDRFTDNTLPANERPNLAIDRRGFYNLVGAVWLDSPKQTFGTDKALANDPADPDIVANGPNSKNSILAGQDRLSGTATQSFTQADTSFSNCLSCHNTQSSNARGIPIAGDAQGALIVPKQINVSRVFDGVVRLTADGILE
jgi:hypothetical protein